MHQALKDFVPQELCVFVTLNIGLLEIDVPGVALMPLSIMHHTYSEDFLMALHAPHPCNMTLGSNIEDVAREAGSFDLEISLLQGIAFNSIKFQAVLM